MLNIDLSRALPPSAFGYLTAFMPGLFFEISILLGNPTLVRTLAERSQVGTTTSVFYLSVIALVLAFIIGNGFMLWVTVISWPVGYVNRLSRLFYRWFCHWPLLPVLSFLMQKPKLNRQGWLSRTYQGVQDRSLGSPRRLMEVEACLRSVVSELLQRRYGIELQQIRSADWVWYSVLVELIAEDVRGNILFVASHATGWSGIAAMWFAPALRNRYFLGFSFFLIFCGLWQQWFFAKRLNDLVNLNIIRVRAVLRQLREIGVEGHHRGTGPERQGL